ncbi:DUF2723 domain-containing protein [candidate division KSB1 bacterium]|nr:DUF2723 domain-containing protein [candidate division KSB1 bacterium]
MMTAKKNNRIFAAIVFLISLFVYLRTIAPTTSFWDCGEFIACSYILGIPHPPGAPFYLLLGRVFSLIPWAADIGLRVNIISALTTALSVMFTYLIIVQLIKLWRGTPKTLEDSVLMYSGGIIGALALAFSDSIWFNAVEAEVYAISLFFTTIVVWLILVWHEKADSPQSDKYILLIAYSVGLAIGVHLLNILALPAVFLIFYFRKFRFDMKSFLLLGLSSLLILVAIYPGVVKWVPNLALKLSGWFFLLIVLALITAIYYFIKTKNRTVSIVVISFFLILLGTSTYGMIYIRSNLDPAIDENDPDNLKNFVSYLNREQYGDWSYIERRAPLWEYQIKKMYIRYLGWQFIGKGENYGSDGFRSDIINFNGLLGIPFLLGIFGMVHHFFKDSKRALTVLLLFFMTGLAIVLYLNQPDPQPRERDYVYVGSYFAFALWIGIGVTGLMESLLESVRNKNKLAQKIGMAIILIIAVIFVPVNMLAFNYHSHDRSGNYVAYDYSYNILQSCEENAIIFTNGDNDTFPLWFLQYVEGIRPDVQVVNLSLLNTHWYIKQLKRTDPPVPITLSDAEIDKLTIKLWPEKKTIRVPVPRDVYQQDIEDLGEQKSLIIPKDEAPAISFELEPTFYGKAIRVQDWMILNIIASNQFRRPIYFAVTVSSDNMLNLDDYLRMDGLCFKLVTYPGEDISPVRLRNNLFERFRYRNLDDPDVYYNRNIQGLLSNYRAAFLRLASFYHQEKMYDDMTTVLDKMQEVIPEDVIPVFDRRISLTIGRMYQDAGRTEEFEERLDYYLNQPQTGAEEKLEFAQIYLQLLNDTLKSEKIALDVLDMKPNYQYAYYWLFNFYNETEEYQKGTELAKQLLAINPNDMQAKVRLEQFREKLKSAVRDSN